MHNILSYVPMASRQYASASLQSCKIMNIWRKNIKFIIPIVFWIIVKWEESSLTANKYSKRGKYRKIKREEEQKQELPYEASLEFASSWLKNDDTISSGVSPLPYMSRFLP